LAMRTDAMAWKKGNCSVDAFHGLGS